jgi:hypothetical protein
MFSAAAIGESSLMWTSGTVICTFFALFLFGAGLSSATFPLGIPVVVTVVVSAAGRVTEPACGCGKKSEINLV